MHGAYSTATPTHVVRHAGNPIFPNGTIAVELKAPADAEIIVELDRTLGGGECRVEKKWSGGVWSVKVGKTGREYPAVMSIAAVRRGK
jgi:hypothetical protein